MDFLIGQRLWFLLILLEFISVMLIYRNNAYQRNIIFSSANVMTGHVASMSNYLTSYLNLREINKELLDRNGQLEMELLELQDRLEMQIAKNATFNDAVVDSIGQLSYGFVQAEVVNNSVNSQLNYITLNKGRKDGIVPDMGVISEKGVVGIVTNVSDNFSVVISLLNLKSRLSCKILGDSFFGSLSWNGRDSRYATLEELPRHVEFHEGDTVVTSGYSSVFPAGLMVGKVSGSERQRDDNFISLEVELATHFQSLRNVLILKNYNQEEQWTVEQEAKRND